MDPTRCECATWAREAGDTLPEHHPACPNSPEAVANRRALRAVLIDAWPMVYYPEAVMVLEPVGRDWDAPPRPVRWRRLRRLLNRLLRATRGGCELPAPPLGWRPAYLGYPPPTRTRQAVYWLKYAVWRIDRALTRWSQAGRDWRVA